MILLAYTLQWATAKKAQNSKEMPITSAEIVWNMHMAYNGPSQRAGFHVCIERLAILRCTMGGIDLLWLGGGGKMWREDSFQQGRDKRIYFFAFHSGVTCNCTCKSCFPPGGRVPPFTKLKHSVD